jgi:uncharacterized Zn finger protein
VKDYAECPACDDDGPHEVVARDAGDFLECRNGCGSWPSPFTHANWTGEQR